MYYKCSSCQKTWYYPIDECLFCHQIVDKIVPQKFTVRGITTVEVPSREHMHVPYNVLLLEDENGQTHARKTFKRYSVGDEIEEQTALDLRHAVAATRIKYSLEEALEKVSRTYAQNPFAKDQKIVIKISAKQPAAYNSGKVTNAKFLALILERLQAKSIPMANITLVDRISANADEEKILAKTGIAALCQKFDLRFANLTAMQHETIPHKSALFDIPKAVLGADLLINMPHLELNTTKPNAPLSMNLMDIFPGQSLSKLKALAYSDDPILPPVFNILDGQVALVTTQDKTFTTRPKLLMLSSESLAIDKALSKIYNLPVDSLVEDHSFVLVGEELDVLRTPLS